MQVIINIQDLKWSYDPTTLDKNMITIVPPILPGHKQVKCRPMSFFPINESWLFAL